MVVNFMVVMIATFIMVSVPRHIIVSGTKKNPRNSERVVSRGYVPRYFPDEREETLLVEPVSELVDEPFPFTEKEKAEILSALPADDADVEYVSDEEYSELLNIVSSQEDREQHLLDSYEAKNKAG